MPDSYDFILDGFNFNTELVFAGKYCGISNTFLECSTGFVHFVREGNASIEMPGMMPVRITKPSLIFFPRPHIHRIVPLDQGGITMVCAKTTFSVEYSHPIVMSFPEVLVIELEKFDSIKQVLEIFFVEAISSSFCRRQIAENMASTLLVYMTRYLVENNLVNRGLIAALGNTKIVKALEIIHTRYSAKLTLESVAKEIGISRSQFALVFTNLIEHTFFDYLTSHRIMMAKKLLHSNKSVKLVASEVGFSNASAFIRKFKEETGVSPGKWV